MRVLLVDDADTVEAYVRAVAAGEGWTLDRARTGAEAMRRVLAAPPDVILLDFVLPDMDGLELLRHFFAANVRAPTIVLSGAHNPEIVHRFAYAGAVDYLAKEELSPPRLRQAIAMALGSGSARVPPVDAPPRALPEDAREEAIPVDPRGAVVLLVDDTETFRTILRKPLGERGWVVLEASDAASGIAQALRAEPDVILLDHVLPDDEGLSVLRAVREQGLSSRVVAFTAHGDEALADSFLREGAVDYVQKETSVARVVFAVERALWLGGARVAVRPKPRKA